MREEYYMEKQINRALKSAMDLVTATTNSVHSGLESIKSTVGSVVAKADKLNSDVAAKAKAVAADLTQKIK
jgi:uncharacterized protein YoxC